VGAGSNTYTAALRVVGGEENGSLESKTVKHGRESHEKDCADEDQQQLYTTDPSSRQKERPTSINLQLSDSNKNLVVSPRCVLYSKTAWQADRQS
jgi:hypothetical protein